MATLPAFLRSKEPSRAETPRRLAPVAVERDPHRLRTLPLEDVYFYCRKIDNSRLVREPDPHAKTACWSAIGVASLVVAILAGVLVPGAASTILGYRLESLRGEERQLVDELRALDVQEAEILRPQRMDQLAKDQNLVPAKAGQVFHLDGNGTDAAVAMVKK